MNVKAATEAATSFIAELNQNPIYHSVWVGVKELEPKKYALDDEGNLIHEIKISIRPRFKHKFGKLPSEHKGFAVCEVPWPKGTA